MYISTYLKLRSNLKKNARLFVCQSVQSVWNDRAKLRNHRGDVDDFFFQSDTEGGVRVGPILETLPLTYFSEDIALARLASSLSRKWNQTSSLISAFGDLETVGPLYLSWRSR